MGLHIWELECLYSGMLADNKAVYTYKHFFCFGKLILIFLELEMCYFFQCSIFIQVQQAETMVVGTGWQAGDSAEARPRGAGGRPSATELPAGPGTQWAGKVRLG